MYQNIEEYIQSQRQQLDVEVPGDAVWDRIDQSLDRKTRSLWERYPLLKVAAAILLFAVGLAVVVNIWAQERRQTSWPTYLPFPYLSM